MKTVISKSVKSTASQEDKAYWERHIKSQRASGISRAAYCRINHVNYDRLSYWLKNNKQAPQAKAGVIPIRLKQEISHEANVDEAKILCTLRFKTGATISIHDKEALCLLLKEMM
jgi:hypothetical protein